MRLLLILSLALVVVLEGCKDTQPPTTSKEPVTTSAPAQAASSAAVVKVRTEPATISLGGETIATVTLSISSGFHVNANPATFSYLIPTEVTAENSEQINVDKAIYPAAQTKKFQFAENPLAVFEGETQIKIPLRAKANGAKGSTSLPIKVRVQACDNEQCFPPATLNTTLAVEVK